MANPFSRYFGAEDHLHHQICLYLAAQYPRAMFWHTPNEGRRTPFERYKAKYLFLRAGVADILCPEARNGFNGLAIEVKATYPTKHGETANKPTPAQLLFLEGLRERGWKTAVVWTFDEAKKIIDEYFRDAK